MGDDWKTTTVQVRNEHEWGTFFVRESEVVPRADGKGFNASAEWCCNSSFGTFGHWWSSMGQPFAEFIAGVGDDYLLSKIGHKVTDDEKVIKDVKRLIRAARKEKRVTKDIAREAINTVDAIASETSGNALCHLLYIDPEVNKVYIEWRDIETQSWDTQSLMFVRKLWPKFVEQFSEAAILKAAI